jgi:cell division protein FtsZ
MPERRARMLSVEETPVVSVPVMAPDNWMRESAPAAAALVPAPPRFLSEDEEPPQDEKDAEEPAFFSAAAAKGAKEADTESEAETELVASPARPQFAEMAEEPTFTPLPRDYVSDFSGGEHMSAPEEQPVQPVPSVFPEPAAESERDLDVPAFMRRLQF